MDHDGLNRRAALRALAAGTIGAASSFWVDRLNALAHVQAAHARAAGAQRIAAWRPAVLTSRQNDTLVTLTELIIPQTDTPGAEAALVNRFIDSVLAGASPADRDRFVSGLAWLDARSTALFGKDFTSAAPGDQSDLLTRLSADERAPAEDAVGVEFFRAVKALTITGYYSTEIGLQQELGDDGQMFLLAFEGCKHPEHQR